jgi:hypothetical protein
MPDKPLPISSSLRIKRICAFGNRLPGQEFVPKTEPDALVEKERLVQRAEQEEQYRKINEKRENERPFNHGKALKPDYAYWAKMGSWKWDEATALSLGRNPLVVNHKLINQDRYRGSPFVEVYNQRRELIQRAKLWTASFVTRPSKFYEWAQKYHIELPEGLVDQLRAFTNPVDWEMTYITLDKRRTELEAVPQAKPEKNGPLTRERNTLVRLVYGMARVRYKWADDGGKSSPASRIVQDMDQFEGITEDTVMKYLKMGKELIKEK